MTMVWSHRRPGDVSNHSRIESQSPYNGTGKTKKLNRVIDFTRKPTGNLFRFKSMNTFYERLNKTTNTFENSGFIVHQQDKLSQVIARIKPGKTVRIHAQETDNTLLYFIEGEFVQRKSDSILLISGQTVQSVPLADVQKLWERGRSASKGAKIGGVVAAALNVVPIVKIGVEWLPFAAGMIATGILDGAVIGAFFSSWHLKYER